MTKAERAAIIAGMREMHPNGHVSPAEASVLLGCNPYSFNVSAKQGMMPSGSYFFAGRNLRISINWLETFCGV